MNYMYCVLYMLPAALEGVTPGNFCVEKKTKYKYVHGAKLLWRVPLKVLTDPQEWNVNPKFPEFHNLLVTKVCLLQTYDNTYEGCQSWSEQQCMFFVMWLACMIIY